MEYGIFDLEVLYTLMFSCFLLNISVPLLIGWWKPYYVGDKLFCGKEASPNELEQLHLEIKDESCEIKVRAALERRGTNVIEDVAHLNLL